MVVIKRSAEFRWLNEDTAWLTAVLVHPIFRKLDAIIDDHIANGVTRGVAAGHNPEWVAGYAAGQAKLMQFIYNHAAKNRYPEPEATDAGEDEETVLPEHAAPDEATPIQHIGEE
jgi:hypothetical protein